MSQTELVSSHATELLQKIEQRNAVVGVIGLGYVGLPLLNAFIGKGFSTIGYDVDQRKVDALDAGKSYIAHIPSRWIQQWTADGKFSATSDMGRLCQADALLICVPTPLNDSRDPDLAYVESTAQMIAKTLRPGQLVVLESTTYPGTTRDVLAPILEANGLKCGQDFFLAYSPEREDPGNPDYTAQGIPKVVGGMDPDSLAVAKALYDSAVVNTVPVSNCEVAEACKILENTYRSVNIAMVNELKVLFQALDIDIWEVIDAAKTKPFGFQAFYPGPGLGGHCIPIDPFYLSWLARRNDQSTRFIELAGEINTSMPRYVVHRIMEALNDRGKALRESRIAMLGVAYKKDVDDPRESPSFKLFELLQAGGAVLTYNDPHIPQLPKMRHFDVPELESQELTKQYLAEQDCVLIATDHSAYDYDFIVESSKLVVDTRNATKNVSRHREKIVRA
ncbi:MAG: nucleotide sugar dehydrogenase [Planctomycetales bacterium]|nr:nucleotide sugar dehydrogenase [Planctomycetales bacterium]